MPVSYAPCAFVGFLLARQYHDTFLHAVTSLDFLSLMARFIPSRGAPTPEIANLTPPRHRFSRNNNFVNNIL
jgi:hypothetical protein